MGISGIVDLTAYGDEFTADPYPIYAKLREQGPVHRVLTVDNGELWLVVGHEAVRSALADPRFSKSWRTVDPDGELGAVSANMLEVDAPQHTRLRKLVAKEFTARRVEALRPRIQQITDELLDAMLPLGRADLVDALAFPLPMTVICELLGVPSLDREAFRHWSNVIVGQSGAEAEAAAVQAMGAYLVELIEDKRRSAPADDLMSALIRTTDEDGDQLSADELVGMAFLLLVAGHETTVNLISNGVLALLRHPDQLAALRADPALLDGAIEEMLRYDGPVETSTWRFAIEPVEIGGTVIPRGAPVLVALASAGRDPDRFEEPDRFDIRRSAQGHVAFGHGIHYCLGAPLARIEGRTAVRTLLERCPDLALDTDPATLSWRPGMLIRGVHRLPVRY
ncbi:cytochrome P450 [Streptomyces sp. H10-C2]|uniref:cytochrome P450 family protein n=1 Tax=unclassified Streptomyces TaxID=2593676 RepID=UPI0024BAEF8E|nr:MULTISPECIES: cytochrome P450 [unclassified Streptomyces]MDJ0340798.1 cytochrome P450 [Streptomyces sp. PH10-H1]MDJ0371638.1 cytochrome P450 [Streptomyces sp. H10-C2]